MSLRELSRRLSCLRRRIPVIGRGAAAIDSARSLSWMPGRIFVSPRVSICRYSTDREPEFDEAVFEKACGETLDTLCYFFECLIEDEDVLKGGDVVYSDGVLTVNLGPSVGTYVINRQSPNRQIWLSSPCSGPKRYDYTSSSARWVYRRDNVSLSDLLQDELSAALSKKIRIPPF